MKNIETFIDAIRGMAQTGLHFARNDYDRQHYEAMFNLANQQYAGWFDKDPETTEAIFKKDLGYVTTKAGANGVVLDKEGRILLEQRKDDDKWGLPGGWIDPQDTPEECCVRELKEETGIDVKIEKLLGVCSRPAGSYGAPHSSCHILYLCENIGGTLQASFESHAVRFWRYDEVPVWHQDHGLWLKTLGVSGCKADK